MPSAGQQQGQAAPGLSRARLQLPAEQNQELQAVDTSFPLTQALQKASAIQDTGSAVILRDFRHCYRAGAAQQLNGKSREEGQGHGKHLQSSPAS